MQKRAIIILAEGFEEIEAVTPIDLLRRGGVEMITLGLGGLEVAGAHGMRIRADRLLEEFSGRADAVILPGGPGHKKLLASEKVIHTIKMFFEEHLLCAAICAGPVVLAGAGILAGKKVTCFPGYENELAGAIPVRENAVRDGTVITGRAAGAAVDFSLMIVEYLVGEEAAEAVAKAIVYERGNL